MFDPKGPSFIELARQALSSTTRGYDLLAGKFEHTPFRTPEELLEPVAQVAAEGDGVGSALDVCCGTGAVMRHLRPICTERVTGIDLSAGMLAEARRQLRDAPGEAAVELIRRDVFEMGFEGEFDLATCFGAFGHILHEQQDAFAERVRAALKPGGRFIFATRPMPPVLSKTWLFSHGFNAAMHLRNALKEPPFIMFYLTFTLDRACEVLERHGFELDVRRPYTGEYDTLRLVVATRR